MNIENYAIIIDYLPKGKGQDFKARPIVQLLGVDYFTLLEATPKAEVKLLEKVYIGPEKRDKIAIIKRRISYQELTANAQMEIEDCIENIIKENPKRFIDFYNNAGYLTIRMHQLELLPSIGKKYVGLIVKEREKKPFDSFDDIEKRIPSLPNPLKAIIKRIIMELMHQDKYFIFTRKPFEKGLK